MMDHNILDKRWSANLTPRVDRTVWALGALAIIFFALRVLARTRRHLALWWDDWILLFAMLSVLGNASSLTAYLRLNYEINLTEHEYEIYILLASLVGTFNSLAQGLSKTSIATTYWRLVEGWWRISIFVLVFSLNGMLVGQVFTYWIKDCRSPGEPYRLENLHCANIGPVKAFRIATQALSLAVDVYLTLLPWKIVWRLNMRQFEKFGLGIAMSLGATAAIAGIVRLKLWIDLSTVEASKQPFYAANIYMWNYIEPTLTVIAACVPVLRVLLMEHIPGTSRNRTRQSTVVSRRESAKFSYHRRTRSGQYGSAGSASGGFGGFSGQGGGYGSSTPPTEFSDLESGVCVARVRGGSGDNSNEFDLDQPGRAVHHKGGSHSQGGLKSQTVVHDWSVEARSFEPSSASGDEVSLIEGMVDTRNGIVVGHEVTVESGRMSR